MKLKTIKTQDEISEALASGYGLAVTTENGTVVQLQIGNLVVKNPYGQLQVFEVQEHEEVTRHRVVAQAKGFPARVEHFERSEDAAAFADQFDDGVATIDYDVKVLVNDDGDVVAIHEDDIGKYSGDVAEQRG